MHRAKNFGQLVKRCFSAQVQVSAQEAQSFNFSKLGNGLKIATCNENAIGTRLSLLVKTGSRDDSVSDQGLTHCLQACAGLTSAKNTAFLTTQLLSSLGASLDVTAGRDYIMYNISCYETAANELILNVLNPSVLSAKFPWYEVRDHVESRMRFQKAYAENDPFYLLMESLHKASFRGSFGKPIMSPTYMIGNHTTDMLSSKFENSFTYDNMVLAGYGIDHDALVEIGSNIDGLSSNASVKRSPASFVSSECHVDHKDDLSYAAIGFEGLSLTNEKTVALTVLREALGTESCIKGGSRLASGVLNQAVQKSTNSPFSTTAFSANYSDCGLFGVTVVAPKESIADVVSNVSAELRVIGRDGISPDALQAAKNKLKSKFLTEAFSSAYVSHAACQASMIDGVAAPENVVSMIDKITSQDVTAVAQSVLGGQKSFAFVGQAHTGIYLKDL